MDCLDGIHARATNQCSRFGEVWQLLLASALLSQHCRLHTRLQVLDHWFDAMTTPLMGSVALIVIQPCQILQVFCRHCYSTAITAAALLLLECCHLYSAAISTAELPLLLQCRYCSAVISAAVPLLLCCRLPIQIPTSSSS